MARLAFVGVLVTLAAAAMLALAAAPLAVFLYDYYRGGVWLEAAQAGNGSVVVTVHYDISVPLTGVRASVALLGPGGVVLEEEHVERDALRAGDTVAVAFDAAALAGASAVRVSVEAEIGGVYRFTFQYEAPLAGGGG